MDGYMGSSNSCDENRDEWEFSLLKKRNKLDGNKTARKFLTAKKAKKELKKDNAKNNLSALDYIKKLV